MTSENIEAWTFSFIGAIGCLLNSIVIIRILCQGSSNLYNWKLYIISLAISDILFGASDVSSSVVQSLGMTDSIGLPKNWEHVLSGLPFVSTMFHMILIAVDRIYESKNRDGLTKKKVIICFLIMWSTSLFVMSTQFWVEPKPIDYLVSFGCTVGAIFFLSIYITLMLRVSEVKCATHLGFSLAIAFIICNLPLAIADIHEKYFDGKWDMHVVDMLASSNMVINPIVYIIFETTIQKIHARNQLTRRKRTTDRESMAVMYCELNM